MSAAVQPASYRTSQETKPIRSIKPESKPPTDPSDMTQQSRDHQEIAQLAYSYWEARGRQDGSAEADWLQAEQALYGNASAAGE